MKRKTKAGRAYLLGRANPSVRANSPVCVRRTARKATLARFTALGCAIVLACVAAFAMPATTALASPVALADSVASVDSAGQASSAKQARSLLPDVADGNYLVDVALEGGTGRASIESPAKFVVDGGTATATIVWSSPNYDYMIVNGERYMPTNSEGNSTFDIPVLAFDEPFSVVADTTAMSTPHEITYELTFDSASLKLREEKAPQTQSSSQSPSPLALGAMAAAVIGVAAVPGLRKRHRGRQGLS